MGAVPIFMAIALAGCAFLLYFLYALWREEHRAMRRPRVEIRRLSLGRPHTGKLVRLYAENEVRERKKV